MRTCPSVPGPGSPLITHRISSDVCLSRQGSNFHKCHRCIYRGMAAAWVPPNGEPGNGASANGQVPAIDVVIEAETAGAEKSVRIPRPAKAPATAPAKAAKKGKAASPARRSATTSE